MISCEDAEVFLPFGKEYMTSHPLATEQIQKSLNDLVIENETGQNDFQKTSGKEHWIIQMSSDGLYEEELYYKNRTVAWSRRPLGSADGTRFIVKSMTSDSCVIQAIFATFFTYPDHPFLLGDKVPQLPTGSAISSICILQPNCLSVYADTGEHHDIALPFMVTRIWPMKYGIILEKDTAVVSKNHDSTGFKSPILYSLLHPLDEINPVLLRKANKPGTHEQTYVTECSQNIVEIFSNPSMCVVYDSFASNIKLCRVRRARIEENQTLLQNSIFSLENSGVGLGIEGPFQNVTPGYSQNSFHLPIPTPSISKVMPGNPGTGYHLQYTTKTPLQSLRSSSIVRMNFTPSPASTFMGTPNLYQRTLNESFCEPEPLVPDICFENYGSLPCISKPEACFLTQDHVGRKFLCIIFPQIGLLKCYKYIYSEESNTIYRDNEVKIAAKHAAPLTNLNMMIIVDKNYSLLLYTGTEFVCHLHLSGSTAFNSTLFKDFSCLNISSKFNTPLNTPFSSSIVRRSSLKTSSRLNSVTSKFDATFSPVATEEPFLEDPALPLSSAIIAIRDPVNNRVTLEHCSGILYRITLPSLSSSILIRKTLKALTCVLSDDLSILLMNKWYLNRNAPGLDDFSPSDEWELFTRTLFTLLGYDLEKLSNFGKLSFSGSVSPMASKKFRYSENGTDADWDYMLESSFHKRVDRDFCELFSVGSWQAEKTENSEEASGCINSTASLFKQLPTVLFVFHLLYEEFKLNTLHWCYSAYMVPFLTQLAVDLKLNQYLEHYWKDFPNLCSLKGPQRQLSNVDINKLSFPKFFPAEPPSIYAFIYNMVSGGHEEKYPYISTVCTNTRAVAFLHYMAISNVSLQEISSDDFLIDIKSDFLRSDRENKSDILVFSLENAKVNDSYTIQEKIVMMLAKLGITQDDVKNLAPAFSLLIFDAQYKCTLNPPQNWSAALYQLVNRPDLVAQNEHVKKYRENNFEDNLTEKYECKERKNKRDGENTESSEKKVDDGMESLDVNVASLRWPEDRRIDEVKQMLQSSQPVTVYVSQRTGVSDHDILEEQERQLCSICTRTLALSLGRGMFTLSTQSPIITESLPIPGLNLKGKAAPKGNTIEFPIHEVPADIDTWPHFHNGVASGLKISRCCSQITSTWIAYNKVKGDSSQKLLTHAGFLMGLGLNGHLKNLDTVTLYDYLKQGHELTCVALILGISCDMVGTMDHQTTKTLSVHLECLLPPTSTELDVPHNVQVAAVLGLGLVYANTGHRHMSKVLLQEIDRPPGPELENCNDRESYSLAAGLGLGLILFGKGPELSVSPDFDLPGQLHYYIVGGPRKYTNSLMREKYKSPSYQIQEGDSVNINVTSPGAILSLGMIYFNSRSKSISDWLAAPVTTYMLDQVRPDFLLLRTMARGLIFWDDVIPSYAWVEGEFNVPTTILQHVHTSGAHTLPSIDYESVHQAYYNILAGACFVLGLKFAGSANAEAFNVLWKYTRMFVSFTKRSIAELAGKSTIETCLCSILLSLSLVMAGTGDLEVLRIIRYLRSRVGVSVSTVLYGSHAAIHMALGFLFLGGGKFSLKTTPTALAALIISCYPKFPTHSIDNRYHLQAFRHLYVLATEPRLFLPVDADTKEYRIAKILLKFSDTSTYSNQEYEAKAPHMLPELSKLKEVIVENELRTSRYWPVYFSKGTDSWGVLESLLKSGGCVQLKLRPGRFPYGESPVTFDYKASHFLSKSKLDHWSIKTSVLRKIFGNFISFIDALASDDIPFEETGHKISNRDWQMPSINAILYDCLYKGKPEIINLWINLLTFVKKVGTLSFYSGLYVWQIKLILACSSFLSDAKYLCSDLKKDVFESNKTIEEMETFDLTIDSKTNSKNSSKNSRSSKIRKESPAIDSICAELNSQFKFESKKFKPENSSGKKRHKKLTNKHERSVLSHEKILTTKENLIGLTMNWESEIEHEVNNYKKGILENFSPKTALFLSVNDIRKNDANHKKLELDTFKLSNLDDVDILIEYLKSKNISIA